MRRWHITVSLMLLGALVIPCFAFALSLGDLLNDPRVGDIVSVAILLDDNAAEKIVSALGSAEVEKRGICTDAILTSRADRVFRRVVAGATRKGYKLRVLNDSTVNAYAVLGGHLYINRGLLAVPGITDDEIAAVVGHEIAHIEKRHGLQQIRQAMIAEFVAGKLTKKGEQRAIAALAGQLWVSGRSQKDEREADLVGAHLARASRYSAAGAVAFMRRMEVMSRNERSRHPQGSSLLSGLEQRLASHPPTNQRCEYLKDDLFVSKYGQDFRLSDAQSGRIEYAASGKGRDSILLQQNPIHIGDDQAGISTIWSKPFDLTEADLAGRTAAKVVFLLRSTEIRRDPNVYFNRVHVGFAVTESRNWERFEFDVPLSALHPGRNLIDIETIIPDLWRTYDDCEFKNVKLVFTGEQRATEVKRRDRGLGVPIVIHFHSKFSDGKKSPDEIADGLSSDTNGVVLTDHHFNRKSFALRLRDRRTERFSEIGTKAKEISYKVQYPGDTFVGYPNYLSCGARLSRPGFHFICGAELSWFEGENEHHLLLLDITSQELRARFVENEKAGESGLARGKELGRDEVAGILSLASSDELHVPTVAAHPANDSIGYPMRDRALVPRLMEFFNNGVIDDLSDAKHPLRADVEQRELNAYGDGLRLTGGCLGVTAGSDFHSDAGNDGILRGGSADQWHRYTYVCGVGERPSKSQLLQGLYDGQTYAAVEDAALLDVSPTLGIAGPHQVSTAKLRVNLTARPTVGRALFLYRVNSDGHKLLKSWTWKGDIISVEYTDSTARRGQEYSYFWYVPGQLITSPIRVKVK